MDIAAIIQLALKYGPLVKEAIDLASSNGDLVTRIKQVAAPLAGLLESIGASLFPKAAPAIHIVGVPNDQPKMIERARADTRVFAL